MLKKFSAFVLALVAVALVGSAPRPAAASPSPQVYTMTVRVRRQGTGLILWVQGTAPKQGAWVGCSMYPPGVKDPVNQGSHTVVHVGASYSKAWHIPAGFPGGTYELALWSRKLPPSQVKDKKNPWLVRNGYLMQGMLVYRHGSLPVH